MSIMVEARMKLDLEKIDRELLLEAIKNVDVPIEIIDITDKNIHFKIQDYDGLLDLTTGEISISSGDREIMLQRDYTGIQSSIQRLVGELKKSIETNYTALALKKAMEELGFDVNLNKTGYNQLVIVGQKLMEGVGLW